MRLNGEDLCQTAVEVSLNFIVGKSPPHNQDFVDNAIHGNGAFSPSDRQRRFNDWWNHQVIGRHAMRFAINIENVVVAFLTTAT